MPLLLLKAPPELLIIGCGTQISRLPAELTNWAARHGMVPEVLATRIACSTFNFMVQEERPVAAVLFPPKSEQAVQLTA
jgi:NADH dehydrogenase [ubiquinone] 1 alpha subcomplex assembly factor 3